jgi:hypothetical protein
MKFPVCVACGSKEDLQHHHLVPRKSGGSDDSANLLTLCTACHHKMHERQMNGTYNHGELTRAGQQRAVAAGKKLGVPRIERSEAAALARRLRRGRRSFRQIQADLFSRGYTSRRGKPLALVVIGQMLEGLPKVPQGCRPWLD